MISEVRSVTLGVGDLGCALDFYVGALGWTLDGSGPIPAGLGAAWRLAPGLEGEMAQLSMAGSAQGRLRLLAFGDGGHAIWNEANRMAGTGFYALNLRAQDVPSLLPRLARAGASCPPEAKRWRVSAEVEVWDCMIQDPGGVPIDIFSYVEGGDLRGPLETEVSVAQTVAIATRDVERCRAFYHHLGFEELFDLHLENLEDLLHVPPGTAIHNVNLMKDGHIVPGRVECFRYLGDAVPPALDLATESVPPNRGVLAITFEAASLSEASKMLRRAGARPIAEASGVDLPGTGLVSLETYLGPDGECLELLSRG